MVGGNARGELIFAASSGLASGVAVLDAFLAPLLGALTPFLWAFPTTCAAGTTICALGGQIGGTIGSAAEPLQLLPARGAESGAEAPHLESGSAAAGIRWWVRRLDGLFGVVSDPAVFTDSTGSYVASKHMHAQLSIDQLFRRTSAIQRAHRDTDARRVLLFTVLDTLERLTSRSLVAMCSVSFAQRTLDQLCQGVSSEVAALLLPAAQRAVEALMAVQTGFFLACQSGTSSVEFEDNRGARQRLPLESAAADYIRVLRNATHGHALTAMTASYGPMRYSRILMGPCTTTLVC